MSTGLTILTLATAVACGLVGGVFYAFSSFVMPALGRLDAAGGAAAMRAINVTAVLPGLMVPFFGAALACLGLFAWALADFDAPRSLLLIAGAVVYLAGVIGMTMAFHVPRNDRLAAEGTDAYWPEYLRSWTAGNHVRAAAGTVAAVLLIAALVV